MKPFDIPEPCHEDWNQMREDGGARHCASCQKHVVDLAGLTPKEVRGLVALTGGSFCGRQTIENGELVLMPERPLRQASPFALRMVLGGAAVATALGAAACAPASAASPDPITVAQVDPDPNDPKPTPTPHPDETIPKDEPRVRLAGKIAPPPGIYQTIGFDKKSVKIHRDYDSEIDSIAAVIKRSPWMQMIVIEGHAASDESDKKDFGLARAEAVRDRLVKAGVPKNRLRAVGVPSEDGIRQVTFRICRDAKSCD